MNGAIILAGGRGRRMGATINKQYLKLQNRTVLSYAIESLARGVGELIIVAAADETNFAMNAVAESSVDSSRCQIVEGGKERQDSVRHALESMPVYWEKVLIHDGARPFVPLYLIEKLLEKTVPGLAVVPALSVTDTIKRVNGQGFVIETPNRALLKAVQTPQAFIAKEIRKLHQESLKSNTIFTDDASICEHFEYPVKVIEGAIMAQKLTIQEDFIWAEKMLHEWEAMHR